MEDDETNNDDIIHLPVERTLTAPSSGDELEIIKSTTKKRRKKRKKTKKKDILDDFIEEKEKQLKDNHNDIIKQRSRRLSKPEKELKISRTIDMWAGRTVSSPTTPELKRYKSEREFLRHTVGCPFPNIPVFTEKDKDYKEREEIKELYKIETAFEDWAGDKLSSNKKNPFKKSFVSSFKRKQK